MIEIKKNYIKSDCKCTKLQIIFELSCPIEKSFLDVFLKNNYTNLKSYTNVGIFYVEDANLIAMGPIGSNRLQIKCKTNNCEQSIGVFEEIIKNI